MESSRGGGRARKMQGGGHSKVQTVDRPSHCDALS